MDRSELLVKIEMLEKIAASADRLESWMAQNAGDNADWPLDLKCDNEETANEFSGLLTGLKEALGPWRKS